MNSMNEVEDYLGGFTSPLLRRGRMYGYGIYVTNRRLFGLKTNPAKALTGAVAEAAIGTAILVTLPAYFFRERVAEQMAKPDDRKKLITELEEKEAFEITKEEISEIEVKKPSTWRPGHILIKPKSGESIKIDLRGDEEVKLTLDLLNRFSPNLLNIKA